MSIGYIFITAIGILHPCYSQKFPHKIYEAYSLEVRIDSLRKLNNHLVLPENDPLELATNIALLYYPELKGNKIRIKYKKNVRHPITASWAFGNIFRFRKNHTYVLLLHPDSWVTKIDFNGQVGALGHELAHFEYYRKRPGIHMLWWGLKYVTSKKFSREFERSADFATVDHGLGWQLLGASFYTTKSELRQYMEESGLY